MNIDIYMSMCFSFFRSIFLLSQEMSSSTVGQIVRSRSNSIDDDGSKDAKSNIRESRLIQDDQWESPEVQQAFKNVSPSSLFSD